MCPDRICIGSAVSLERAGSTGSKVNVYISSKVWKCTPHTSSWQLSRQAPLLWLSTMVGPHRRDPILNLSGASGGGRQAQLPSVPCRPRAPAGDTMSDGTQSDGNGIAWGMGWMGGERASEHGERKKAHRFDLRSSPRVPRLLLTITSPRFALPLHAWWCEHTCRKRESRGTDATAPAEADAIE